MSGTHRSPGPAVGLSFGLAIWITCILVTVAPCLLAQSDVFKKNKAEAEAGSPEAQYNLGIFYGGGRGVPQDLAEAVKWYRKAADQGFAPAQNNLGIAYAYGKGVSKDLSRAIDLYRQSAAQNYALAQYNLGGLYDRGDGVRKNMAEAAKWYQKAAEQGHAQAQYNVGLLYANGEGVPKNSTEAVNWYCKAARQGFAEAQNNLGLMYWMGEGVRRDYVEAYKLLTLAAKNGFSSALQARSELEQRMTGGQISDAKLHSSSYTAESIQLQFPEAIQVRDHASPRLPWTATFGLADVVYSTTLLLLAAPLGLAFEKRRKLRSPQTLPYGWGYAFGCMLAGGTIVGLLGLFFCDNSTDFRLLKAWAVGCGLSCYLVFKRKRWGWILGTIISVNPAYYWVNWIYARNRWAEFKSESKCVETSPSTPTEADSFSDAISDSTAIPPPIPATESPSTAELPPVDSLFPTETTEGVPVVSEPDISDNPSDVLSETTVSPPPIPTTELPSRTEPPPDASQSETDANAVVPAVSEPVDSSTSTAHQTFYIIGVERQTGDDIELTIRALTEANARVKAELKGVIVTSIAVVPAADENSNESQS